ncbi:MAG: hypothetical protein CMF74_10790 [Maricaulis sp.]|jgi:hypothetical protein|nr:hypothetical protein [Maricaulis sp.]|tara:strand:+ start:1120 stop:1710 length:591 start_codon:yes stop_codon:yes gene_type:complete
MAIPESVARFLLAAFRVVFWSFGAVVVVLSVLAAALAIWVSAARFLSWRTLSAEMVRERAEVYVERYLIDDVGVCIYVVRCDSGRARLEPVDVDEVDFDALRDRIWGRRFRNECPGQTANLGLHLVALNEVENEILSNQANARWAFATDRFGPRWTRFGGGAFSEEPWLRCTPEHYAFIRRGGVISASEPVTPEGE